MITTSNISLRASKTAVPFSAPSNSAPNYMAKQRAMGKYPHLVVNQHRKHRKRSPTNSSRAAARRRDSYVCCILPTIFDRGTSILRLRSLSSEHRFGLIAVRKTPLGLASKQAGRQRFEILYPNFSSSRALFRRPPDPSRLFYCSIPVGRLRARGPSEGYYPQSHAAPANSIFEAPICAASG